MSEKLERFVHLMEKHAPLEGANYSPTRTYGILRQSEPHPFLSEAHIPAIVAVGQGRKYCTAGERRFEYSAGTLLGILLPIPLRSEIIEASPEKPFFAMAVQVDMTRIASVLHRIEQVDSGVYHGECSDPSSIFAAPLSDTILDPFIRLLQTMDNPRDSAVLSGQIIDEIYYRMLVDERGGEMRYLLQQRGEIQRISKAVGHIHTTLDQPVSVEELASLVHMSRTTFYNNFKSVMHVSPLQYAKTMKLHRARALLMEGKRAGEAAYLVGYSSTAQFSREYRRQFGYTPSQTRISGPELVQDG